MASGLKQGLVTMLRCVLLLLVSGCVEGPPVQLPFADPIYSCSCVRDGVRFAVELCYDGTPQELATAVVANEERVTEAVCSPSPRGSCHFSCETEQSTCVAAQGCYCK